MNYRKKTNIQ